MVRRSSHRISWLALPFLVACGAPGDTSSDVVAEAAAGPATSDPYEHGFTDADYPRLIEVAEDVYAYEQIHPTGGEIITTVSLIVVTPEGVLVADGQENPEETQRLVDTIAGMTDQPITHVVVASDHGDHTGRELRLPRGRALPRALHFRGDPGGERGEPEPARRGAAGRRPDGDRGR